MLKHMVLRGPVHIVGITDAGISVPFTQKNQVVRLGIRQQLQQDGIHHGKDGRVRADAQRQRKHGNGGKAGVLPQHAHTVANVLKESPHG